VATHNYAVNRDPATWPDQDHIPGAQFGQAGGLYAVRAPKFHLLGQEIQEILNCTAAAADREFLKDLGDQDEEHNHQRREHFSNS
jgi:hypothetical protein